MIINNVISFVLDVSRLTVWDFSLSSHWNTLMVINESTNVLLSYLAHWRYNKTFQALAIPSNYSTTTIHEIRTGSIYSLSSVSFELCNMT